MYDVAAPVAVLVLVAAVVVVAVMVVAVSKSAAGSSGHSNSRAIVAVSGEAARAAAPGSGSRWINNKCRTAGLVAASECFKLQLLGLTKGRIMRTLSNGQLQVSAVLRSWKDLDLFTVS